MPHHTEHVFPRDDTDFVALVDLLALTSPTPRELERRLRETYPKAVVRARELSGENTQVRYVYRDGTWKASRID
jgi:hypothetical protein